jgi:outer membrane immunogenic protein
VGGGLAWAFSPNWSVFAEYNHYDFGNRVFSRASPGFPIDTFHSIEIRPGNIETVKVGLNYRFGG